jgi:hypothetical protein
MKKKRIPPKKMQKYTPKENQVVRCEFCEKNSQSERIHQCQICGIPICKDHFHGGFCEPHYVSLQDQDKQKVQAHLLGIASNQMISRRLCFAGLVTLGIGLLVMMLLMSNRDNLWLFSILIYVLAYALLLLALLFHQQKTKHEKGIQEIAEMYRNR